MDNIMEGNGLVGLIALFLIFALFTGGGFFGGGRGEAATVGDMQRGFDTSEIFDKLNGLENGMCDGFYAQNTTMLNGFNTIGMQIAENRFSAQQCCCETNRNIDNLRYENAKNTCDIITASNANAQRVLDALAANEIQMLRDKVADLQLQNSQCAQNAYLVSTLRPYGCYANSCCNM